MGLGQKETSGGVSPLQLIEMNYIGKEEKLLFPKKDNKM